jgi:hypothetical protein
MESAEDPDRKPEGPWEFFPRYSDLRSITSPWAVPRYDVSAFPPLRIEVTESEDLGTWGPTDAPEAPPGKPEEPPEPDGTGEGGAHAL